MPSVLGELPEKPTDRSCNGRRRQVGDGFPAVGRRGLNGEVMELCTRGKRIQSRYYDARD